MPVNNATLSNTKCRYLPFFVTKQDKARVVFDGPLPLKEQHLMLLSILESIC